MISSMRLALMKLVVSRSILKIATAESRSSPIVFLRYVLIRRKAEKDRSAEHDEVGMRLKFFPFPPFLSFFFLFFFPFLFFFLFPSFSFFPHGQFTVRRFLQSDARDVHGRPGRPSRYAGGYHYIRCCCINHYHFFSL